MSGTNSLFDDASACCLITATSVDISQIHMPKDKVMFLFYQIIRLRKRPIIQRLS